MRTPPASATRGQARLVGQHDRSRQSVRYRPLFRHLLATCWAAARAPRDRLRSIPATGRPYAMSFPVITIRDMVRLQKMLIDSSGHLAAAVRGGRFDGRHAGARMGGQLSGYGAVRHSDRHHLAAQRAADRFQRSGPAGHHGRSRLGAAANITTKSRRRADFPWRAWWATSPI